MKPKLVYEAKYPHMDLMEYQIHKAYNPGEKNLPPDEFLNGVHSNTQYTPIPKRTRESEEFIKEAIEISRLYQMDTQIFRFDEMIRVFLSFDFGANMQYISHLFGRADRISFFKEQSEQDIAVCLDFYTHVVVKSGIAVAP